MNSKAYLGNLLIYRNLLADDIISGLRKPKEVMGAELESKLMEKAEELGLTGIVPLEYIFYAIAHQKNILAVMAESHEGKVGRGLKEAVAQDVILLRAFIDDIFEQYKDHALLGNYIPTTVHFLSGRQALESIFLHVQGDLAATNAVEVLCNYYATYGYGLMLENVAFRWDGEQQRLIGTRNYSNMTFEKIYGYESQKSELIGNTEAFLQDKPANNVLMFGDRGTGKSSSIKALGNKFFDRGLRLVEVSRQDFVQLPKVMSALSNWGKHFIVVLDDLSFEEFEVEYKSLKSILDGGLEVRPKNVLFYATSNRRNIIKEVWQDQDQRELHNRDTANEKISLADRFGIKLFFDSMDQKEYFEMLERTAADEGLAITRDELRAEAVKWEMRHTGRNGRVGRQLLDYLQGKKAVEDSTDK